VTRGGEREGAGQPPKYGVPMTERWGLELTEADAAEIQAAVPDGKSRSRWIVEAALARARPAPVCEECQRLRRVVLETSGSFTPEAIDRMLEATGAEIDKLIEVTGQGGKR